MIQRYVPNRKLRSSSAFLLKQNKWNLKSYGFRTFTVAAPFLWNSLPLEVKSSPSLNILKTKLKTHLFKSEFTRGPGRGDTCHLSVFDETLPG